MKKTFTFLLAFFLLSFCFSQNIKGRWTGYYKLNGESEQHQFEIEFIETGGKTEALTYTKFKLNNREFYSVCKAKVEKDSSSSKIIVTEYEPYKRSSADFLGPCFQKHILWFTNTGKKDLLNGVWETATEREDCGKGVTALTRNKKTKHSQ
ncbi:MAG: hypothetical protein GXC73_14495 [Chitinophagaceae bacterium]|nr:hypothetical protein [Chitinophagaceae bacterium]